MNSNSSVKDLIESFSEADEDAATWESENDDVTLSRYYTDKRCIMLINYAEDKSDIRLLNCFIVFRKTIKNL